jgi:imidazolonepropionase-like amidohydrolase
VHTMAGPPIERGVVVMTGGKITAVGPADRVTIPEGFRVLTARVAVPGLIDARGTIGVSGLLNQQQDQDQLERSSPLQPELRAIDAYNPNDKLVEYARTLGVTTIHTGHAPGEVISGQTCIVKTVGRTVDEAVLVETAAVAGTLGPWAQKSGGKSPGTRAKEMSLLRDELLKAQEYQKKREKEAANAAAPEAPAEPPPDEEEPEGKKGRRGDGRSLRSEMLVRVLSREVPLLITCNRAQDIASALRLAREFNIRLILDSAAESYLLIDDIKQAQVPVILHPTMFRMFGEMENMSMETAAKLRAAGVPVAIQSGYESYVPKARIVLFEAAIAAANGLTFEEALAAITIDAAKILGIDGRVGSLEVGKDADVALYDGDPFEYTTHCVGVVVDGQVVSEAVK